MTRVPDHEVVIVGSGFAGLGMAIELRRAGRDDFVLLEKADAIGGTWRDNHYPGCACDVQSHLYSFSFAPNPDWTRMYAPQEEIWRYLDDCVDRFGIRGHIRLGAEMTSADYDEGSATWSVEVNGGERISARYLVAALGGLSRPSYPDIPGLDEFEGTTFHSADWNHDYDPTGKRVAVVGTGASSIQFTPQLARQAAHVDVYQRTPPWVIPQLDRPVSPLERRLFRRVPAAQKALRALIYVIQESVAIGTTRWPRVLALGEAIGRRYIRRQISDPELQKVLTPDYRLGCKRILISNHWYQALDKPHVDVVTDGIEHVTRRGIVSGDGTEREVDAIILGTGFRPTDLLTPLTVRGRDGVDLNDAWRDGVQAHLGTTVAGFPNAFLLVGPNTGTGHNSQLYMIESQIRYVLDAMRIARERDARAIEVRADVQDRFNAKLQARMPRTVWASGGCHSWYLDATGRNTTLWPGFTFEYRRAVRAVDPDQYVFEPAALPATGEPATVTAA